MPKLPDFLKCSTCPNEAELFAAFNVFTTDIPGVPKVQVAQVTFDYPVCIACSKKITIKEAMTDHVWWEVQKRIRRDFDKARKFPPNLDRGATLLGWRRFKLKITPPK